MRRILTPDRAAYMKDKSHVIMTVINTETGFFIISIYRNRSIVCLMFKTKYDIKKLFFTKFRIFIDKQWNFQFKVYPWWKTFSPILTPSLLRNNFYCLFVFRELIFFRIGLFIISFLFVWCKLWPFKRSINLDLEFYSFNILAKY